MKFEISNGSFKYKVTEDKILHNVNIDISAGDVMTVLGPNGSGKTTLLRCALGMLRWESGTSLLDGRDIRHIPPRELWQQIAYVPQARQTISPYSVEDTVLLGRTAYRGALEPPSKEDYDIADSTISRMRLDNIRHRSCSELSGGELQMVLIARAMAAQPKLLVLDEPESNLDFRNQLLVLDTISELARSGMACIFNTHYPSHALRRSDKSLLLGHGGITEYGPTAAVVTEHNIRRFFGVNAVIGEIETDSNIYRDVVAISIDRSTAARSTDTTNTPVVATLSVILPDGSAATDINGLIHTAAPHIIGRMGMPLREDGFNIINLIIKAPPSEIKALADSMNRIPGVSVKATYAKGEQA